MLWEKEIAAFGQGEKTFKKLHNNINNTELLYEIQTSFVLAKRMQLSLNSYI